MANEKLKNEAYGAGIKLWELASAMGIADCSLSRKLRRELPEDEKAEIRAVIAKLATEREVEE